MRAAALVLCALLALIVAVTACHEGDELSCGPGMCVTWSYTFHDQRCCPCPPSPDCYATAIENGCRVDYYCPDEHGDDEPADYRPGQ